MQHVDTKAFLIHYLLPVAHRSKFDCLGRHVKVLSSDDDGSMETSRLAHSDGLGVLNIIEKQATMSLLIAYVMKTSLVFV